jgi:hypothetical protein
MEQAWTHEVEDIAREFNVDVHCGLSEAQVSAALTKYGKNGTSQSQFGH